MKKLQNEIEDLKNQNEGLKIARESAAEDEVAADFVKEVAEKAASKLQVQLDTLIEENTKLKAELSELQKNKPAPTPEVPTQMLIDSFNNL